VPFNLGTTLVQTPACFEKHKYRFCLFVGQDNTIVGNNATVNFDARVAFLALHFPRIDFALELRHHFLQVSVLLAKAKKQVGLLQGCSANKKSAGTRPKNSHFKTAPNIFESKT